MLVASHVPSHHTLSALTFALALTSTTLAFGVDDPPAGAAPTSATSAAPPAPGPLAPSAFATIEELSARARTLAALAPSRSSIKRIGVSREGKPIEVVTLGEMDTAKKRPELLIVAGMDAVNFASAEQALASAELLARDHVALLDKVRVHVLFCANPDARVIAMETRHPRATNVRRIDHDRDGTIDEDQPQDLNGDGMITLLRRVTPPGARATHMIDPANPHIMRSADRAKGEVATHDIFIESRDVDGDGFVGEDPATGVDLEKNFPHRWPEFETDAGPFPLSEPESLAIAQFVRDHPAIVSAVIFGRHDTLAGFPDTKDKDSTGRTPLIYLEDDHGLYRELSKSWRDVTNLEKSNSADLQGSLVLWLANHRGIAAVAANGWTRPEVPPLAEGSTAPAPIETGDNEQQAWLDLCDRLYASRGFLPWTHATHPKYGTVDVGGFVPFLRESPTALQAAAIAKQSASFVPKLAERMPEIEVSEATCTDLGGGLARIGLRITNRGALATTTEMGRITGVVPPVVVRVGLKPDDVIAGRAVEKLDRIAASEARDFEWTVRMPKDAPLAITVSGPFFDDMVRTARTTTDASNVNPPTIPTAVSKEVTP